LEDLGPVDLNPHRISAPVPDRAVCLTLAQSLLRATSGLIQISRLAPATYWRLVFVRVSCRANLHPLRNLLPCCSGQLRRVARPL